MGTQIRQITNRQADEDITRRLIYDLEALIDVLKMQTGALELSLIDKPLRGLNAAQVIMAPRVSITKIVGIVPTFLIENTSTNLVQVTFSNDDLAVPCYIGDRDLVIPAGDLLDPRQRLTYILRRGQKKYGICLVGTINVIVSEGESAYGAVTMDAVNGDIVM
jgi:hypothetical protein